MMFTRASLEVLVHIGRRRSDSPVRRSRSRSPRRGGGGGGGGGWQRKLDRLIDDGHIRAGEIDGRTMDALEGGQLLSLLQTQAHLTEKCCWTRHAQTIMKLTKIVTGTFSAKQFPGLRCTGSCGTVGALITSACRCKHVAF